MTSLSDRITYPHALLAAHPVVRGGHYCDLLEAGHEARKNAGAFDRSARELTKKSSITKQDLEELLEVLELELQGTCKPHALDADLRTFAEEWGFKFEREATALVEARIGRFKVVADGVKARTPAQLNGVFYRAVEDGKITEDEVERLVSHPRPDTSSAHEHNLTAVYGSDDLRWEGNALVNLRANLGNAEWVRKIDLRRALKHAVKNGDGAALVERAIELFPEGRDEVVPHLEEAAQLLGVDLAADLPATDGAQAASSIRDLLHGDLLVDSAIARLNELEVVNAEDAAAFSALVRWVYGPVLDDETRSLLVVTVGLNDFYWDDPSISLEAVSVLDELIHGSREQREFVREADILTFLSEPGVLGYSSAMKVVCGDPSEDALEVTLSHGVGGNTVEISISGYRPNETLTLTTGPSVSVVPKCNACPSLAAVVNDARLTDAVRYAFHRAAGTQNGHLLGGIASDDGDSNDQFGNGAWRFKQVLEQTKPEHRDVLISKLKWIASLRA